MERKLHEVAGMHPFPHHYTASAIGTRFGDIEMRSDGLPTLGLAAPAEFDGPGDRWSPEALLVAAIGSCVILTFRAVAQASKLDWTSLACEVAGTLDRVDRTTRFVAFEIRARLTVPAGTDAERATRALEKAEANCLISRSLSASFRLVPTIVVAEPAVSESGPALRSL
jgi:organic hydroperoxide reductase OsmC/OhrA